MDISDKFEKHSKEPPEKENMIRFVDEYLHDRNGKNAALRIGITAIHSDYVAKYFLEHPYVQNLIKEREAALHSIVTDKDAMRQEIIRNLLSILKKDDDSVKQSERISAGKMLAEMMDLVPKQQAQENNVVHNVLIAPPAMNADDWSALAMKSQEELKAKLESSLEVSL